MKIIMMALLLTCTSLVWGQNLNSFSGDYTLDFSVSACNANARVLIDHANVQIMNPDPRDNRGWSTTKLTLGVSSLRKLPNGNDLITKVSQNSTDIVVETIVQKMGREISYQKDIYRFRTSSVRTSLLISLGVETRGNISDYGTTCAYEKK